MKRYAAQYLFVAGRGYLRMAVADMGERGPAAIFPLHEEVENTEWLPGVLLLVPDGREWANAGNDGLDRPVTADGIEFYRTLYVNRPLTFGEDLFASGSSLPGGGGVRLYSCPSFQFGVMLPCVGTRHRRLL